MTRFVVFGTIFIAAACFGIAFAGPLGQRDEKATTTTTPVEAATVGSNELATTSMAIVDTLNTVDETGLEVAGGNETHIRQKRSCGCCCCRPCCCCCKPCCCCCRCCCQCCCRCCCCCCRPCCCCCRPCCCCCRPCCGCCGCGGGRKRRSIQALTHKLMDKQAALLRSAEYADAVIPSTTTTVAVPEEEARSTTAIYTNAHIDGFGRSYSNLAFADFNQQQQLPSETPYENNDFYFRQLI
uniref:Uncharacterized protein n=1 Tax=Panagrolaimus superbus TaxID=310955 RepID=A0A914YST9_9BILA